MRLSSWQPALKVPRAPTGVDWTFVHNTEGSATRGGRGTVHDGQCLRTSFGKALPRAGRSHYIGLT